MDDANTRKCIQDHADAVVRGDMDAVIADFIPEMRPNVPQVAQRLPQPVTSADVLSTDVGETETVAQIRYSGEAAALTIRSHWREVDGRPLIFQAEPID